MATLRTAPLALGVALALGGCTYVTNDQYQEKLACLDEDGDGAVRRADCPSVVAGEALVDCDDSRSDRFPGNPEIPYDGIDQDCDNQDVVDVDGDGFPGILEADWTPAHSNLTWPSGLQNRLDCDDEDDRTYPDSPFAVPYDGVNSACVDLTLNPDWDDWDQDGDGHVPYASLFTGLPYTGDLPQDDCDDFNADVSPSTTVADTWYDGIDQDCDGANDFDQDGDGYIRDQYITLYQSFLAKYKYTDDRPCTLADGSCNDCEDDPTTDGDRLIPAAQINPGQTETWYDGVDQNCDGANDFDQDGDGFECDGSLVSACSGHMGLDCVDTNPNIRPNALELIGDAVDQDCTDGVDGARLHTGIYSWTTPYRPTITANDGHYLLGVTADERIVGAAERQAATVLLFPVGTAMPSDTPALTQFVSTGNLIGESVALRGNGADFWMGASVGTQQNVLLRNQYFFLTTPGGNQYAAKTSSNASAVFPTLGCEDADGNPRACPYLDTDLQDGGGDTVWVVGCNDEVLHFARCKEGVATVACVDATDTRLGQTSILGEGRRCYVDDMSGDTAKLRVYTASYDYLEYDLTSGPSPSIVAATADHPSATWLVDDVRNHGDLIVFAGGPNGSAPTGVTLLDNDVVRSVTALASTRVYSADAVKIAGHYYIIAVTADQGSDGIADVVFLHGTNLSALSSQQLSVPGGAAPISVAIFADADRVLAAVTADGTSSDVVGWSMWGFAP